MEERKAARALNRITNFANFNFSLLFVGSRLIVVVVGLVCIATFATRFVRRKSSNSHSYFLFFFSTRFRAKRHDCFLFLPLPCRFVLLNIWQISRQNERKRDKEEKLEAPFAALFICFISSILFSFRPLRTIFTSSFTISTFFVAELNSRLGWIWFV